MIDRPAENKSVPGPNPSKPPPEAIRKAKDDFARTFAETVDRIADAEVPKPATGPKIVGYGACPKCFVEGGIWLEVKGTERHLKYVGCKCAKGAR